MYDVSPTEMIAPWSFKIAVEITVLIGVKAIHKYSDYNLWIVIIHNIGYWNTVIYIFFFWPLSNDLSTI